MKYVYSIIMEGDEKPIGNYTFREPVNIGDRVSVPVGFGIDNSRSGHATPVVIAKIFLPKKHNPHVVITLRMT